MGKGKERIMNGQGAKYDNGKPQLSLIDYGFLEGIARIREYGVAKYKDHDSWKTVPEAKRRYTDAMLRHLFAYLNGEEFDEESCLPHYWHFLCNAMFIYHFNEEEANVTD